MGGFLRESRLIIIWLGEENQQISEDMSSEILSVGLKDINLLKRIEPLLKKHYGRSWAYVGAEKPFAANVDYLNDLKKYEKRFTNKEYKRILDLTVERKLPVELELVLFGGDKNEFHTHKIYTPTETDFQVEFYLVAETQTIQLEFWLNEKKHTLKLSGPSLIIVGDVPHKRVNGECLVVKHISGNYKQIVQRK